MRKTPASATLRSPEFGRMAVLAAVLSGLFSTQAYGTLARADALPEICAKGGIITSAVSPPLWPSTSLFRFESKVPAAFPVGSDDKELDYGLKKLGFIFDNRHYLDTAFADKPEENARASARIKSGELVNVSTLSWKTICGRIVFSVGWDINECNLINEIHADVEYCQFDTP